MNLPKKLIHMPIDAYSFPKGESETIYATVYLALVS